ncbi:TonB-dependent receptor [bacterium]|nr:TonB-dependent receptor [bacterium]
MDLSAIEDGVSAAFGGKDLGLGFKSVPILALGNDNLDVEKITTFEIGYSNILARKVIFNLNYFRSHLKNFVTDLMPLVNPAYGPYVPPSNLSPDIQAAILYTLKNNLPPSLYATMSNSLENDAALFAVVSYSNAGKANAQGIELALKYFIRSNLTVDFNYTWFDFSVEEELIGGEILANTPRHRVNLGADFFTDRFDISMRYRWIDAFPWAAGIFAGPVQSYNLVDLTSNFHFGGGITIGITVNNLLDKNHYQSFGGDLLHRRAVAAISYSW